jgi:hypothetical protein
LPPVPEAFTILPPLAVPALPPAPLLVDGRMQMEVNKTITIDAYEQDSNGFYHLPPTKEASKKKL